MSFVYSSPFRIRINTKGLQPCFVSYPAALFAGSGFTHIVCPVCLRVLV